MTPEIQIIIPVGPGHEDTAVEAIKSAQDLGFDCVVVDDTEGLNGRSKSRNIGVQLAEAEWLFFLDADDLMHPECKRAFPYMREYDAIWGLINTNGAVRVPQVRKVTMYDLINQDPYRTLQMGHFIRRKDAVLFPFNEHMDIGEDFDYYFRVWSEPTMERIKIPHSLFINRTGRHSKGLRSGDGRAWALSVREQQARWKKYLTGMRA